MLAVTRVRFGDPEEAEAEETADVGIPLPATMAMLGLSLLSCAVLLAGLPPLSGFVAKFALLSGLLQSAGPGGADAIAWSTWAFVALLILSGMAALLATTRAGVRSLWDTEGRHVPSVRSEEHTSELQSLMRISYAVFCLKKKKKHYTDYKRT